MKRTVLALSAAIAVALATLLPQEPLQAADPPRKPPPAAVHVAAASSAQLSPTRWMPGSVVSRDDARIASGTAGRLVSVAETGTRLPAGGVVARLDDGALRLRLEEMRAEAGRAKAQSELAERQWKRLTQLAPKNSIAATQLDEARAAQESARHDLARSEARVREIERELSECEIRTPFPGVVTERYAQRGEWVQAGTAVAHVVDTEHLELKVQAPLAFAAGVKAGARLALRGGGGEQSATVRAVVPVGDERSRQFELRAALPEGYALVGTPVEAALPEAGTDESLTVPRDALVLRQDHTYVVRVKADNTAERIDVQPGQVQDDRVAVTGALAAGDRVVVRGAERLEQGQAVRVLESG